MAFEKVATLAEIPVGCARAVNVGDQDVAVVHLASGVAAIDGGSAAGDDKMAPG